MIFSSVTEILKHEKVDGFMIDNTLTQGEKTSFNNMFEASDYCHSQINEISEMITNIRSPAYTYLFLWIFIRIYRKITLNER